MSSVTESFAEGGLGGVQFAAPPLPEPPVALLPPAAVPPLPTPPPAAPPWAPPMACVPPVAGLVWLAAAVSFPGIAGWLPVLRNSPWTLCVLLLLMAASLAYAWPGVRAGWREWLFAAVTLTGLLCPFRFSSASLRQLAHRPFTAQDVFILGFDSVTKTDTLDLLERFQPSQGSKRIYTNAQTPYPATIGAWRSIFIGQDPPR